MNNISAFAVPLLIVFVGLSFFSSEKDTLSVFFSGCREGMKTTVSLVPTFILLSCAVKMFCASGALDGLCALLSAPARALLLPAEMLPVVIMRPISGSGSVTMIKELFSRYGTDSFASYAAALLMGSTDTIVFTLSAYFSACKTKKTGFAFPVSVVVLLFCAFVSCRIAELFI